MTTVVYSPVEGRGQRNSANDDESSITLAQFYSKSKDIDDLGELGQGPKTQGSSQNLNKAGVARAVQGHTRRGIVEQIS
jgi:hypothetical protein